VLCFVRQCVICDHVFHSLQLCCFTASWKQLRVDDTEKTWVIIRHLDADEVYCIKMKSVSFIGDSPFTLPLKRRVFRTGNYTGVWPIFEFYLSFLCCLESKDC